MEKAGEVVPHGLKRLELIKSFRLAVRSLLTAFPFEIITSLHELMQVGTILDTVEDPLFSQKTNIKLVKQDLLAAKKNEILMLQNLLDKVEDEKHSIKARIKLLKKTHEETSVTTDAAEKLRSMMANYSSSNGRLLDA